MGRASSGRLLAIQAHAAAPRQHGIQALAAVLARDAIPRRLEILERVGTPTCGIRGRQMQKRLYRIFSSRACPAPNRVRLRVFRAGHQCCKARFDVREGPERLAIQTKINFGIGKHSYMVYAFHDLLETCTNEKRFRAFYKVVATTSEPITGSAPDSARALTRDFESK